MSVLGLIMSFPPYLRSAMVLFPLHGSSDQGGCSGTLILAQTDTRIACLALP